MSLYLKYRPVNFKSVVNQKHIIDILNIQVEKSTVSNNFLFFWPRGTGKTTTARILARAVNCTDMKDWSPCNQCNSCQVIMKNKSVDFVEIDAASHTSVENVREEIIGKAPYSPTHLKKKIYIIDEVHMLSKSAFNALLKIMEEPPAYLMFILATTEINKVPETIVSRCQVFNFRKLNQEDIVGRIKEISDLEWFEYEHEALWLIAKVSDWAMRDAIKYLEQVSILWKITEENVSKFLGVAPDKMIEWLIDLIRKWDIGEIFAYMDKLTDTGIDLYLMAKEILIYIDNHLLEDISYYVILSDLFKSIMISIKNYPYPLIAYKTGFYKFLNWTLWESGQIGQSSVVSQSVVTGWVVKKNVTKTECIDNNIQKVDKLKSSDQVQDLHVKSDDPILHPSQPAQWSISWEELLQKVAELCEKVAIKTALNRYSNMERIDWDGVVVVIINEMQYNLLTKPENLKYLEELFSQVMQKPNIKVSLKYITKEDYLKTQLW